MVIWTNEALLLKNKSTLCLIWIFLGRMRNFLVCRLKFDIVYDDVNNQCVFVPFSSSLSCMIWLIATLCLFDAAICYPEIHCVRSLQKGICIHIECNIYFPKKSILLYSRLRCLWWWILNNIFLVWEILRIR